MDTFEFESGLVVGKFYPFHLGHAHLIGEALKRCYIVEVIVIEQPDQRPIGLDRAFAVQRAFPYQFEQGRLYVDVLSDLPYFADDHEWAQRFRDQLIDELLFDEDGYDAIFSSEAWTQVLADKLEAINVVVDLDREVVPISGRHIRAEPEKYLEWIHPKMRWFYEGALHRDEG